MTSPETGIYTIAAVDFTSSPPTSRPVGLSQVGDPFAVVILPEGAPPPKWHISRVSEAPESLYLVRIHNETARPAAGNVVHATQGPPFEWLILRSAPHPPPVGHDAYAIFLPPSAGEQRGWGYDFGDPSKTEIPVILQQAGMPWHFVRVDRDA